MKEGVDNMGWDEFDT